MRDHENRFNYALINWTQKQKLYDMNTISLKFIYFQVINICEINSYIFSYDKWETIFLCIMFLL